MADNFDKLCPVIEGKKIILRPITLDDTHLIVKWRNDEAVRSNFIFREPFTNEMHTQWMLTKVATGKVIQFIIVDKANGQSVGSVYLRDVDRKNESAEYGIFIGEECGRGRGFGSEAARLVSAYALGELGLHRLSLRLLGHNLAAKRSYERAGFIVEGIFADMVKLDGEFHDVIFMSKIAGENIYEV